MGRSISSEWHGGGGKLVWRSNRIWFCLSRTWDVTTTSARLAPNIFTLCPKAGCPRTHSRKYEMPYRPKEIYLETFYDYKYVRPSKGSLEHNKILESSCCAKHITMLNRGSGAFERTGDYRWSLPPQPLSAGRAAWEIKLPRDEGLIRILIYIQDCTGRKE